MKEIELTIGGMSKQALLELLKDKEVRLNPSAEKLFQSDLFQVSEDERTIELTEISLTEMGFKEKPNLLEIIKFAQKVGLSVCPVEVAPFLRLNYDQKNSHGMEKKHKTPDDVVTIISKILDETDHYFPKGFYLRKIDGDLWLRGYICDYIHRFELDEVFIFEGKMSK